MDSNTQPQDKKTKIENHGEVEIKLADDTFDCPVCTNLLYDPLVTSCGHVFCKSCILRGMDHGNKCPLCRTIIHVTPENGVCSLLQNVIKNSFPNEYEQRKAEIEKELKEQEFHLPLFLLGDLVLFPGMALPLHVFEPRYRLMIRRCLEGGRRFGVVPLVNGHLTNIGTTALIENHWMFPDGRSLVMTIGEKRFNVGDTFDQDGYTVASVTYLEENPLPTNEEELLKLKEKFENIKSRFTDQLADALPKVEEKFGPMPTSMVEFSMWIGGVLPISTEDKYKLLTILSTEERLNIIESHLSLVGSHSACTIQ